MKFLLKKYTPLIGLVLTMLVSCSTPETITPSSNNNNGGDQFSKTDLPKNVLITCFGNDTEKGSVTYITRKKEVHQDIYKDANSTALKNNLHSMSFDGVNFGYLVQSGINEIRIIQDETFEDVIGFNANLTSPKRMLIFGSNAYISNLGSDTKLPYISLVPLSSYESIKEYELKTAEPDQIHIQNGKLYITHKNQNVVSVLNLANKNVQEITVADNPSDLLPLPNGNLGVLSKGKVLPDGSHSLAAIQEIDLSTDTLVKTINFKEGDYPTKLFRAFNNYYFSIDNKVYTMGVALGIVLKSELFEETLTDFVIDGNTLYGINKSDTEQSTFVAYNLISKEKLFETKVGIGASSVYLLDDSHTITLPE